MFTHDNNRNTLTKVVGSNTTTYAWDYENRLTSVTLPGSGGTVSFKYDPAGRRIYKSSSSGTSVYAYDGDNLVEETNSSGSVVARYADGLNIDEPLAMLRSGATSYYHADGLGSITSLSNTSGSIAQTYTFDSFGNQTGSSGSLTNPFRYTARESDTETGLYYYRARYYDQNSGRFISEDPIRFRGGRNFYRYAKNNPVDLTDPRGLKPCGCGACRSGRWSGTGTNFGGILFALGVFTGIYTVDCWGGNTKCMIMTTCFGQGLGLGGGITADSIFISGACSAGDLSGVTDGFVGGGGAGIFAVGGAVSGPPGGGPDAPSNPSSSSSGGLGVGFGLGGGYIVARCKTTVLSCTQP